MRQTIDKNKIPAATAAAAHQPAWLAARHLYIISIIGGG